VRGLAVSDYKIYRIQCGKSGATAENPPVAVIIRERGVGSAYLAIAVASPACSVSPSSEARAKKREEEEKRAHLSLCSSLSSILPRLKRWRS